MQGSRILMSRNVSILSVVAAMVVLSVLSVATVAFAEQEEGRGLGQEKVTLCHNGHTLTVGAPAEAAHLNHGDTSGACGEPTTGTSITDMTETTTSPTATGATTDTTATTATATGIMGTTSTNTG